MHGWVGGWVGEHIPWGGIHAVLLPFECWREIKPVETGPCVGRLGGVGDPREGEEGGHPVRLWGWVGGWVGGWVEELVWCLGGWVGGWERRTTWTMP